MATFSVRYSGKLLIIGKWNDYEIKAVGNRIITYVDGKIISDYVDVSPEYYKSGSIRLQCRPESSIQYEKIEIAELDSEETSTSRIISRENLGEAENNKNVQDHPVPSTSLALLSRIPSAGPKRSVIGRVFGTWSTSEGEELVKEGLGLGEVSFGDLDWTDYDLTFEARKSAGPDGFGTSFRAGQGKKLQVVIGGLGGRHYLQRYSPSLPNTLYEIRSKPGTIRALEWYKVMISLRGQRIRVELDGHVLFDCSDD